VVERASERLAATTALVEWWTTLVVVTGGLHRAMEQQLPREDRAELKSCKQQRRAWCGVKARSCARFVPLVGARARWLHRRRLARRKKLSSLPGQDEPKGLSGLLGEISESAPSLFEGLQDPGLLAEANARHSSNASSDSYVRRRSSPEPASSGELEVSTRGRGGKGGAPIGRSDLP